MFIGAAGTGAATAEMALSGASALALAWALDAVVGEPRDAWHPVAWFGRMAAPLGLAARRLPPLAGFAMGVWSWCGLVGLAAALACGLERLLAEWPVWLGAPALALALKPAFAWRMLKDEVAAVEAALADGLDAGRARLGRICSRDPSTLTADDIREAAIETLAENLNDSLVAPLFWFAVAGLPGAWAWRAVNTLDAMWGYRGPWEWAGKWAARADDVLAWVPARITALLLSMLLLPTGRRPMAWCSLWREAGRTASPNGGWPMAAIALRLGVRLGKPGVYLLNGTAPPPDSAALEQAIVLATRAAWVSVGLALLAMLTPAPWPR